MTHVQQRNSALAAQLLPDLNSAWDRNLAIEIYDDTGGQSVVDSPTVVNLDQERLNSAPSLYGLASDVLTVAQAGIFQVGWHMSIEQTSGGSTNLMAGWLEADTGSGWAVVDATTSYVFCSGQGLHSMQSQNIFRAGSGDQLRIVCQREDGSHTMQTVAQGARLQVVCLQLLP